MVSSTAAAWPGAAAFERRALARGDCRRSVCGAAAVSLGTMTAAGVMTGVMAGAVTITAVWMVAGSFAATPGLGAGTPFGMFGIGAATFTRPYTILAGAADFSGWAGISPPRDADPVTTASLTPAPAGRPQPSERASARVIDVSLFSPAPLAGSAVGPLVQPQRDVSGAAARPAAAAAAAPALPKVASAEPAAASAALFQKSLTPPAPRNASLSLPGPDSRTAIYDIEAHTVYLPNGARLEAHSGLGTRLDDPRYVKEKDRGPTPPNVYDLALREEPFHGVRAIRLNPVDDGKMFNRDGMLAHTYMLGPSGQSFGCVSFKNYPEFLKAYLRGEVERLVVVPHLEARTSSNEHVRRGDADRLAANNR
jgi:Protein of unknown function (DUF2778)